MFEFNRVVVNGNRIALLCFENDYYLVSLKRANKELIRKLSKGLATCISIASRACKPNPLDSAAELTKVSRAFAGERSELIPFEILETHQVGARAGSRASPTVTLTRRARQSALWQATRPASRERSASKPSTTGT